MSEFIRLTYLIETPGDPARLAEKIASDQSTGTFVDLPGETEALKNRVAARVVELRYRSALQTPSIPSPESGPYNRAEADIDYPLEAIGIDLAALMTIAISGAYAIKGFTGLRVIDMKLPEAFRNKYLGPQFGVIGSRKLTAVYDRPIIGTIIKPALGLRPNETAELVCDVLAADADFIKDDEKLMSPNYSPLSERIKAIMPMILDREQKTGKKTMYAWGISATDPDDMLRNHDMVLNAGGNCAVININSIGFGAMQFLRKRSGLVVHAHRNGWDLLTRHPGFGMDFKVWQQFWRLLGVDQFQINGIRVKYWEPDESFIRSFQALTTPLFDQSDCPLPVAGSGQWGGQAHDTYNKTGRTLDLMYLCGGGVVSHPSGAAAGVRAVKQAWQAAVENVPLEVYARDHKELSEAIAKFAIGNSG